MPSEDLVQRALDAVAGPREAFRAAVQAAVEEVGARIDAERVDPEGKAERVTHELGAFAAGRIDGGRFAAVFASGSTLSPGMIGRLEQAHERLRTIADRSDEQFVVRVPAGSDVRSAVARALAAIGGAFAAAREVEVTRNGRSGGAAPEETAGGFPFRRWNRAERRIGPPLVIEVEGGDAQALGLAEFLDGGQKLVLVLRGGAPAAPLARLVTPGVFVMQTRDAGDLAELATVEGPGIAALVPEGGAEFVHRPGESDGRGRFELRHLPGEAPQSAVGSFSVLQQLGDLAYLRAAIGGWKSEPSAAAASVTAAAGGAAGVPSPSPFPPASLSPSPTGPAPGPAGAETGAPAPAGTVESGVAASGVDPSSSPFPVASPSPAVSTPTTPTAAPVPEPADRLAAWLLRQADFNRAG